MEIKKGQVLEHYKGGIYEVLEVALHTETEEMVVCYRSKKTGLPYVRPLDMFYDEVEYKGKEFPRFKVVNDV